MNTSAMFPAAARRVNGDEAHEPLDAIRFGHTLLRPVDTCYVTDSSGCHRYDYWNEQALFDGRTDTGWCTPSRTKARTEYLEIDLGRRCAPARLRIRARAINRDQGFPRHFGVFADVDGAWTLVLEVRDPEVEAGCWHEWDLAAVPTSRLRMEMYDVGWRAEGKYFLQFMQLEVLEVVDG